MLAGVLSADRILWEKKNPKAPSRKLSTKKLISAVLIEVFIFCSIPAPRYWAVTTEAPMPPPMAIITKTVVSE